MNVIKKVLRFLFMILYSKYLFIKCKIKISSSVIISRKTVISRHCVIHAGSNIANTIIGYASYIGENCKLPNVQIGAYCSIAHNIEILSATHPASTFVSTHPAFFSMLKQSGFTYTSKQLFQEALFFDEEKKVQLKIGNDVWIGANVLIKGGLEIGDGAIIAAGSVVTKSVMPFDIVGGVPAKVIRSRFTPEQIIFLKQIQWWNKSRKWLHDNVYLFEDIELFKETLSTK